MPPTHVETRLSPSTIVISGTAETVVLTSPNAINLGTAGQTFAINGILHITSVATLTTSATIRVRQGQNASGTIVGIAEIQGSLLLADQTLPYSEVDTSSYPNLGNPTYYTVTVQLAGVLPGCTVDEATIEVEGR